MAYIWSAPRGSWVDEKTGTPMPGPYVNEPPKAGAEGAKITTPPMGGVPNTGEDYHDPSIAYPDVVATPGTEERALADDMLGPYTDRPAPTPTNPTGNYDTSAIPEFSPEEFRKVLAQIDKGNWWNDYKRFQPYFDKWNIQPQIDSSGSFRGRFLGLPGGLNQDIGFAEYGWGAAPYDTGPVDGGSTQSIDPSYLAPWQEEFVAPGSAAPPDPWSATPFEGYDPFSAPTGETVLQDPSYQFVLDQAKGALTNNAASRGTLNTTGTLYDLGKLARGFASQEYGNVYNRDLGKWNTDNQNKFNLWDTNQTNSFTGWKTKDQLSKDAYSNAWSSYLQNKDTWYRNQDSAYNKLYGAGQLGAS